MNQRELLTSGPDGDGIVHAFYATATRTLCNKLKPPTVKGWPVIPTCDACFTAARAFHKIDGSCPKNWHGLALGEVAVVERLGPDVAAASSSTRPPRVVRTVEGIPPDAVGLTAFYTRESIIAAIQRWEVEHGEPPKSTDWLKSLPGWPNMSTVIRLFGKWSEAIAAAGLDPTHHQRKARAAEVAALATRPGGASRDRVALAVLAAGRAFVETLERELLEALENEAA